MNLLSGLAAVSRGVQLGLEDGRAEEDRQRRIKREEADMAWQDEARGRQRSQWTQADEEQERQKRIKSGLAEAYKPYTPEEIDLGMGDGGEPNTKGYRIDGQLFQSMDDPKAKQALTELNSPLGQAKRLAQVYMKEGDYPGAQKVLADAMRTSVDQFNLDRLAREADHLKANDALFASLNGEAGSNKFENGARVATLTQQFGLNGKEVKAEFTADGKRVVMGIYGKGEDGNPIREGALATYTNDRQGLLDMYADFHKGSPEQKIALWKEALARDRLAQEDQRKAEEHTSKIGLQSAQADYYGKLGEAATAKASNPQRERLPEHVTSTVKAIDEELRTINSAIVKATAEGSNVGHDGIKQLQTRAATLKVQRRQALAPYGGDPESATQGDPLGIKSGQAPSAGAAPTPSASGGRLIQPGDNDVAKALKNYEAIRLGNLEQFRASGDTDGEQRALNELAQVQDEMRKKGVQTSAIPDRKAGRPSGQKSPQAIGLEAISDGQMRTVPIADVGAARAAAMGLEAGRRADAGGKVAVAAETALRSGDRRAAFAVQSMDGFGSLDRQTQLAIYDLVNRRVAVN